jgi:hypothetical protein
MPRSLLLGILTWKRSGLNFRQPDIPVTAESAYGQPSAEIVKWVEG